MALFTRDKVIIAADKNSYIEYDAGSATLNIVVAGTTVMTMTATTITAAIAQAITDLTFAAGGSIVVDEGTATASSSAATVSKMAGKVTTEALTTAAQTAETLTITNTEVAATDIVLCSVANGTNTQGVPVVGKVTPGAGSFTVALENQHASQALNGTLVMSFVVLKTA